MKLCLLAGMTALAAWLTGCAALPALPLASTILTGSASSELHNATAVRLDQNNFVTVRTNVVGQAKGFSLLGIITIVPAQFGTAMDRLYTNATIQAGRPQTFANVVVDRSSTYLILYSIPKVAVRADVVEFVSATNGPPAPPPPGPLPPPAPPPVDRKQEH